MRLSYRGANYNIPASILETAEGEIAGSYRGVPWRTQFIESSTVPGAIARLRYRGANYTSLRGIEILNKRSSLSLRQAY
jgi:hypothetical protein